MTRYRACSPPGGNPWRAQHAFTLFELILVLAVLGILAAIVVPSFMDRQVDAQANSMASVVQDVRARIRLEFLETGAYPASIDPTWFGSPLVNSFGGGGNGDQVFVANSASHLYPANKTVTASDAFSMWYNRGNGSFCVRVSPQGNAAASLALFNRVNGTAVTAMGQRN